MLDEKDWLGQATAAVAAKIGAEEGAASLSHALDLKLDEMNMLREINIEIETALKACPHPHRPHGLIRVAVGDARAAGAAGACGGDGGFEGDRDSANHTAFNRPAAARCVPRCQIILIIIVDVCRAVK